LLPHFEGGGLIGGHEVVWLCDTPTSEITKVERNQFIKRTGEKPIVNRFLRAHSDEPLARFTVKVGPRDRKLRSYGMLAGPWASKDRLMKRALLSWWVYFGPIPPSKLVECIVEASASDA
jgi:hypothetical protein